MNCKVIAGHANALLSPQGFALKYEKKFDVNLDAESRIKNSSS